MLWSLKTPITVERVLVDISLRPPSLSIPLYCIVVYLYAYYIFTLVPTRKLHISIRESMLSVPSNGAIPLQPRTAQPTYCTHGTFSPLKRGHPSATLPSAPKLQDRSAFSPLKRGHPPTTMVVEVRYSRRVAFSPLKRGHPPTTVTIRLTDTHL